MNEIQLTQEALELKTQAPALIKQAAAVAVVDGESYVAAGEWWTRLKLFREKWAEKMKPITTSAHQLHKMTVALEKEIDKPLEERQRWIKGQMESYDREQQARAKAEELRLAEIARKAQEERVLAAAIEAEKNGQKEIAQAIINTPVQPVAVVIPKDVPKLENGPTFREVWQFEIERADLIPRAYLVPDMVKIGQVVRAMKSEANIPGIKVFSKRV